MRFKPIFLLASFSFFSLSAYAYADTPPVRLYNRTDVVAELPIVEGVSLKLVGTAKTCETPVYVYKVDDRESDSIQKKQAQNATKILFMRYTDISPLEDSSFSPQIYYVDLSNSNDYDKSLTDHFSANFVKDGGYVVTGFYPGDNNSYPVIVNKEKLNTSLPSLTSCQLPTSSSSTSKKLIAPTHSSRGEARLNLISR